MKHPAKNTALDKIMRPLPLLMLAATLTSLNLAAPAAAQKATCPCNMFKFMATDASSTVNKCWTSGNIDSISLSSEQVSTQENIYSGVYANRLGDVTCGITFLQDGEPSPLNQVHEGLSQEEADACIDDIMTIADLMNLSGRSGDDLFDCATE